VLLNRADTALRSIEATYRIWRPEDGGEVLHIWRADGRAREQHEGGPRDGAYGVRDGELWWSWDERNGATSNRDDPKLGSGIGEALSVMLDPTPLLGLLRFATVGHGRVAARETITAEAVPRRRDPRRHPPAFELYELGPGADCYTLEIDAQRGVLLEVLATRDGDPFNKVTTVAIAFDRVIPEERFTFEPPPGEEIQPTWGHPPERISVREAQQRAAFTVLIPDRIPSDWHVSVLFREPSPRPPWPGSVALIYSSDDGHESVSLSQFSVAEKSSMMLIDDDWEDVGRNGRAIRATRLDASSEARAQLEYGDTFVILTSRTLTRDELATIGASLKPAPSKSSI